ncbi:MAG: hypothetical protein ABH878_09745 [bacterium]
MNITIKPQKKGIGRKIAFVLLFVLLAAVFVFGDNGLTSWRQLQGLCEHMEQQNDSLELCLQDVSERIRAIEEADSLELERLARFWGMAHPNEAIYIIRDVADTLRITP